MSVGLPQSAAFYERLAYHADLPFVSLQPEEGVDPVNPLAAQTVPAQVARQFGVLPISLTERTLTVATSDPANEFVREMVAQLTRYDLRLAVAAPDDIQAAIDRIFGGMRDPLGVEPEPQLSPEELWDEADWAAQQPVDEEGLHVAHPARGRLLGEMLIQRGLVSPEELDEALEIQERSGSRLGEIVHHSGLIGDEELAQVLADQFRVPLMDLSDVDPDPAALGMIPEQLCRDYRLVPVDVDDEFLYVAVADALDDETAAALEQHTTLRIRAYLTTRQSIDNLLQRIYADQYVRTARTELLTRFPEDCANRVLSGGQTVFLIGLIVVTLICFVIWPRPTVIAIVVASITFYMSSSLYKFKLIYDSLGRRNEIVVSEEELITLDERQLPVYTILVPLYREAEVLPRLVGHIEDLDYPKAKLDVKLLVEQDDEETIETIESMNLLPHFRTVVVPDAQPKTKPKACNYGLLQADGEYVVIYDAEDRPDPDQLKKSVIAFQRVGPHVACVQCKLNYFNQDQNMLTRWFSTEYSMHFDLILPGLDAQEAPIPLGGTSNHFIKDRLIEIGGWDPFNVTEDADLGIRLHKAGYETAMLDSTTLEEANSELFNWVRQRSRWVKGYIQTYLVHMRHPVRLLRQIGWKSWFSFQMMVGGTAIFLLNPIYWGLTTIWLFTESGLIESFFPGFVYYAAAFQLFVGNFVFMYLNVAGSVQRGYFDLAKYALLSPVYWGLMSIGAWKGFIQLFYRPFYWEKTVHGLDIQRPTGGGS